MTRWIAVIVALCAIGCAPSSATSPSNTAITLTTSSASAPVNGSIEVVARATRMNGEAVPDGTAITFLAASGTMTPKEAYTASGVARSTFVGTFSGLVSISASSGPARSNTLDVRVGAAAVERITLRMEPSSLPANGGTVSVIATAVDASGNAMPSTPISFSSDTGTLSRTVETTDSAGVARVSLTTGRSASVTASAGARIANASVMTTAAPVLSLSNCATGTVGAAVTCTITPTLGGSPLSSLVMTWGDGTAEESLGAPQSVTTASHTYARTGTFTIALFATDASGQSARQSGTIAVSRQGVGVTITGPSTGTVGSTVAFGVSISGGVGSPSVSVDFGDGTSQTVTAGGVQKTYSAAGTYTVTATVTDSAGSRGSSSTSITISAPPTTPTPTPVVTSVTISQEANAGTAGCASFFVLATPKTGATISSISVSVSGGAVGPFTITGASGRVTTCSLTANTSILTATATDSTGGTASYTLIVR